MPSIVLEIKDECRANLLKYTQRALSFIPEFEKPAVLDLGCGSGVTIVDLARSGVGKFFALDNDQESLKFLEEKIAKMNLQEKLRIINDNASNPVYIQRKFDLIIAEGLLNVIGFDTGLEVILRYLKSTGYVIIHDELKNHIEKIHLFNINNLRMITSFRLNEEVWLEEYYKPLEEKIRGYGDNNAFEKELKEIEMCKTTPQMCRSIFYVLQKRF